MTLPNIPVCPYSPTPAHEPEQSSYTGFPKALYQLQVIWLSLQFCCSLSLDTLLWAESGPNYVS